MKIPLYIKVLISLCIGLITWKLTVVIPHPITLEDIDIGDIGVPLLGFIRWSQGEFAYGIYHGDHEVLFQYPFTGMLAVAPLLILPPILRLPIFLSISSGLLAYGLLKYNQLWRLLIFVSFPFISTIHSGQFSLLVAAAILLPCLLPVAVVKPQSSVFLIPSGHWNKLNIFLSLILVGISFILYPNWVIDWITSGDLVSYDGLIPILSIPGILLLSLLPLIKIYRARLLFFLSLMPQRIFYDQVSVFLIPKSWQEMLILVIISWVIALVSKYIGWISYFGQQDQRVHFLVVLGLYLPMLWSVVRENWVDKPNLLIAFLRRNHPHRPLPPFSM
jgi:hypothetical protein